MSYAAADGANVYCSKVTRFECDRCGVIWTSRWPCNDREEDDFLNKHMFEKHGGSWRSAQLMKGK